jgi:hypothetical protein
MRDRVNGETVAARLAEELHEAALAAHNGGQHDLARNIDDRVEVLRWATEQRDRREAAH